MPFVEAEDHQPQANPDLRRCQAHAIGGVHRLVHVSDDRLQAGIVDILDRFCYTLRQRISHFSVFLGSPSSPVSLASLNVT